MATPEERLAELGLELPEPPAAVANYVGIVVVDRLAFLAGHGPVEDGGFPYTGKLGSDVDIEEGRRAAHLVMLNMLATLKNEIGELDRVARVVKLLVMVNSHPSFAEQPAVANGASDLLVSIFGEDRGRHARSAVGMAALPFDISVEIEGIFALQD
ncbi:MAG: RidA family protein [Actinomycetia bacterium]|nr:RidA family protein [Actinomycetes bacterium]